MTSDVPCANTATPSRNKANGMKKPRNLKSWNAADSDSTRNRPSRQRG